MRRRSSASAHISFPLGDEPGRDPDPFYTADYLAANGFDVVVCPSSSCYGDSVFAPRTYFHMRNTADSFRKGLSAPARRAPSSRAGPYISSPGSCSGRRSSCRGFIATHSGRRLRRRSRRAYVREHFGVDDLGFFAAAGQLATRGLFNYAADLGFFKDARPAPREYVERRVEEIAKAGELGKELAACERRLGEYRDGLDLFGAYGKVAKSGHAGARGLGSSRPGISSTGPRPREYS